MEHLDVQAAHRLIHGQLDDRERARHEAHLDVCKRCRDLLESERAFSNILRLAPDSHAEPHTPAPTPSGRIEAAIDQMAGLRRRRLLLRALGGAIVVILALLLALQVSRGPARPRPADLAAELRISPEMQDKVVDNLAALRALDRDPWLEHEYESVDLLDKLILGQER